MQDDERCCGTGTCLIDAQGRCWCGQRWDDETLCAPGLTATTVPDAATADRHTAAQPDDPA